MSQLHVLVTMKSTMLTLCLALLFTQPLPTAAESLANCSINTDPNELPSTPPWAWPGALPEAPICAQASWECYTAMESCCTATKCTTTFIGACMDYGTLVNKECGCPDFRYERCSNCTTPVERAQLYRWLNMTCGDVSEWDGLPQNWVTTFSELDLVWLGGTDCLDDRYECLDPAGHCLAKYGWQYFEHEDGTIYQACLNKTTEEWKGKDWPDAGAYRYSGTILPWYNMPVCVDRDCPAIWQAYNDSLVDYNGIWQLNLSATDGGSDWRNMSVYLERTSFCSGMAACEGMCASPGEQAALQLWLNNTCTGANGFSGMVENWADVVAAGAAPSADDPDYGPSDRVMTSLPSCAAGGVCRDTIQGIVNRTAEDFCVVDQSGRYCQQNVTLLSISKFCGGISYPETCADTCTLAFERRDWLSYLNETCLSPIPDWKGLPSNWVSLLSVQTTDLRPWQSVVVSNTPLLPIGSEKVNCPSPESNLGVFAAVNLAMLLLTPILGRRTVVAKLSFGLLGKAHSQGWMLMGPVMACMHTAANLINVAVIRATPGYESTSIATLTMLWFTRPRLAWLVIALVVFQADEAMYLSCAATTLTAEILLQLLTAYVMGFVANHARKQDFYSISHGRNVLDALPKGGGDALAMYAGALLWLVVVVVMIYAVAVAVIDVNGAIVSLARVLGMESRGQKKFAKDAKKMEEAVKRAQAAVEERLEDYSPLENTGEGAVEWDPRTAKFVMLPRTAEETNAQLERHSWFSVLDQIKGRKQGQLSKGEVEVLGQIEVLEQLDASFRALQTLAEGPETAYKEAIRKLNVEGDRKKHQEAAASENPGLEQGKVAAEEPAPSQGEAVDALAEEIMSRATEEVSTVLHPLLARIGALMAELQDVRAGPPPLGTWSSEEDSKPRKDWPDGLNDLAAERWVVWNRWKNIRELASSLEKMWQTRTTLMTSAQWVSKMRSSLRNAIRNTLIGMCACWVAQWLFWVGFVRLYTPDAYCPPKLTYLALTWIFMSVFGAPLGASF
ncbi:hypothetical protein B0H66DRAFT_614190 [Apodospora peruviana]|uniref:TRP C-terminal domain-containing protein n=1 Tax=Apodospora peruviana TaxID=516989 RepID=A0AAE0HSS1_9PEZI|nr:hypothetical protein B0H66DRAFT_614190 [Apodospora peruviana]